MIILNSGNIKILTVLIIFFIVISVLLTFKENISFSKKEEEEEKDDSHRSINIHPVINPKYGTDNYHKVWNSETKSDFNSETKHNEYKRNINKKYSDFHESNIDISDNILSDFELKKNPNYIQKGNNKLQRKYIPGKNRDWNGIHSYPEDYFTENNYCKDKNNNLKENEFCEGYDKTLNNKNLKFNQNLIIHTILMDIQIKS
jgi:hypothetical protein